MMNNVIVCIISSLSSRKRVQGVLNLLYQCQYIFKMSTLPSIRQSHLYKSPEEMRDSVQISDQRRLSIESTLAISPMIPRAQSPQKQKPTPPPEKDSVTVGDRLYRQNIRNARKPIRRMRSRSADALDIVQLEADIKIRRRLDFMSSAPKKPDPPPTPTAPKSPVKPGPRRPSRPTLVRKPSQDDSNIQMRSQRRPSLELARSPFDRCSMFSVKKYVHPSQQLQQQQTDASRANVLTNIKNGVNKGMLKCVYTGPAVFWKKRINLTVAVYLHATEHDCFEIVPTDPSNSVQVSRLFVRPSLLFKLKEKVFQSKLASISAHRKDLLEQSRLHLAGEIIVSTLRVDSDESTAFPQNDAAASASSPTSSSPNQTENSEKPLTAPTAESTQHEGDTSGTGRQPEGGNIVKVTVIRELVLSLPHYNGEWLVTVLMLHK
jgi:hypothetical protein